MTDDEMLEGMTLAAEQEGLFASPRIGAPIATARCAGADSCAPTISS